MNLKNSKKNSLTLPAPPTLSTWHSTVPREIPLTREFSSGGKKEPGPSTPAADLPTHEPQQQANPLTEPTSQTDYGSHQAAHSESLTKLTDEGLSLLKFVCKDRKKWLLLQMYCDTRL